MNKFIILTTIAVILFFSFWASFYIYDASNVKLYVLLIFLWNMSPFVILLSINNFFSNNYNNKITLLCGLILIISLNIIFYSLYASYNAGSNYKLLLFIFVPFIQWIVIAFIIRSLVNINIYCITKRSRGISRTRTFFAKNAKKPPVLETP